MTTIDELKMINGRLRGDIEQLKKELITQKELNKEIVKSFTKFYNSGTFNFDAAWEDFFIRRKRLSG